MTKAVSSQIVEQLLAIRREASEVARYQYRRVLQKDMGIRVLAETVIEHLGQRANNAQNPRPEARQLALLEEQIRARVQALFEPGEPAIIQAEASFRDASSDYQSLYSQVRNYRLNERIGLRNAQIELGRGVSALTPALSVFWIGPLATETPSTGQDSSALQVSNIEDQLAELGMVAALCLEGGVRPDRKDSLGCFALSAPQPVRFNGSRNSIEGLLLLQEIKKEVEALDGRGACHFLRNAELFSSEQLDTVQALVQRVPDLNAMSR